MDGASENWHRVPLRKVGYKQKKSQEWPTEGEDSPGRGGVGREEVCGEKDFRLGQGQGGVLAPEEHWLEALWQEYLISWTVWLASPAWKWPVWLSTM